MRSVTAVYLLKQYRTFVGGTEIETDPHVVEPPSHSALVTDGRLQSHRWLRSLRSSSTTDHGSVLKGSLGAPTGGGTRGCRSKSPSLHLRN